MNEGDSPVNINDIKSAVTNLEFINDKCLEIEIREEINEER